MSNPFHGTLREHLDWCKERALLYLDRGDVADDVGEMRRFIEGL